ncbi:MAG: hypothetical protein INR71_10425, partial [Terriglobus roseus]|nr:hypothetical protein [Terriglobus roseus]
PERRKLDDNVLFDADFPEDEDDFGAFEGGSFADSVPRAGNSRPTPGTAQSQAPQSSNLVDLDFGEPEPQVSRLEEPWQAESKVASFRISTPAEPDRFVKKPDANLPHRSPNVDQSVNAGQAYTDWAEFDDWMEEPASKPTHERSAAQAEPHTRGAKGAPRPQTQSKKLVADIPSIPAAGQSTHDETQDETWDDFDQQVAMTTTTEGLNPVFSGVRDILPEPPSTASTLPPTNIPPPSLVFTLFAPAISDAQTSFFTPLSTLAPAAKTEALSHIAPQTFVRSYIALGVVAARTIAGRKLRWKRDTRLSQGMRIGAAGGKGMKLAGVDKSELAKEDREVAELVRVWNAQVGKLRAVVAPTKHLIDKAGGVALGTVPDLKTVMPAVTAKEAEGAVPSQRPCALCGLKREERLAGIEKGEVGDMFGEWWVESANMHRSCRNFWEARSGDLRTR